MPAAKSCGPQKCAASALSELPQRSRESRVKYSLGRLSYLASKDKGENSMVGKRLNQKVCMVKCRKSCVQEVSQEIVVKPELVEF